MAEQHAAFVGSIPQNYDRYLGPVFFHHYADDLAARLPTTPGMQVLETACGTGIADRKRAGRQPGALPRERAGFFGTPTRRVSVSKARR